MPSCWDYWCRPERADGKAKGVEDLSSDEVNFHLWALTVVYDDTGVDAEDDDNETAKPGDLWPMFMSLGVLVLQQLVLFACLLSSNNIACTANDQCRDGEFCHDRPSEDWQAFSFTFRPNGTRRGFCDDCWYAFEINNTQAMIDCGETNIYPLNCEEIVGNHLRFDFLNFLVLLFTCAVVMQPVLEDMDAAAYEQALVKFLERRHLEKTDFKTWEKQEWKRALRSALVWMSYRMRIYVIAPMVIVATTAMLLSGPLSAESILENGLTIGFVTQFDEALVFMYVRRSQWKKLQVL
jgi:hypothetical protein